MEESLLVLAGKFGIGVGCAVLTILLVRHHRTCELGDRAFDRLYLALAAAMRISLFVVLYQVMGLHVTGDVPSHYFVEGELALKGQLIYRDFQSSYSPLFPYLVGLILALWHSPEAIVAAAIVIELLSLPIWLSVGRRWFTERTVRTAALLYATSPVPFLNIAMKGHNQVWVSMGLAVSLWLLARRDARSGLVQGFTLIAVKALSLLYAPVLWLFADRRARWLLAFVALPVVTIAACLLNGINVAAPLQFQAQHFTGGNLPYLTTLFGLDPTAPGLRWVYDGLFALAMTSVFLFAWSRGVRRRPENVIHLLTLVMMTFFLFSKKSYTSYMVMSFFVLCLTLACGRLGWRLLLGFAVFGILAALEPSLHFHWMFSGDQKQYLSILFKDPLPDGVVRWKVIVFLIWDLLLIACYAACFFLAWRRVFSTEEHDSASGRGAGETPPVADVGQP